MLLDEDQQKIVNHRHGHALVIAGAGSGKTHTIVSRAIKQIQDGISPESLLMLTYTNKGCAEIRERFTDIGIATPTISTFHGYGYNVIRSHPEAMQMRAYPSIMDAKDQQSLLRDFMRDTGIAKDELKGALKFVDLMGNEGFDYSTDREQMAAFATQRNVPLELTSKVIEACGYFDECKRYDNVLDYNDLINLPIKALRYNPDLREQICKNINDICVDECQDNNNAQSSCLTYLSLRL